MIDTSLFGIDVPAGTYAVGDKLQLNNIAGPSVVRSGRGAALLKRATVGLLGDVSGSFSNWKISIKNSDWVDPMISLVTSLRSATALDEKAGSVQRGNNCPLTPNSSWYVEAECTEAVTTTVANSLFAAIDIDYPGVSSIIDPDALPGIPASIDNKTNAVPINALGSITSSRWTIENVDIFKAGFEYALQKVEAIGTNSGAYVNFMGFISIANAAGMAGLTRIMPIASNPNNIRNKVEYASKLVKGPMDIGFLLFANSGTATTADTSVIMDFVKRRV